MLFSVLMIVAIIGMGIMLRLTLHAPMPVYKHNLDAE